MQVRQTEADVEGRPQLSVRGLHESHLWILHHRPQTAGGQTSFQSAATGLRLTLVNEGKNIDWGC